MAFGKELELGLDVLIRGGFGFMLGKPFHFVSHLLAVGLEILGNGQFLLRQGPLGVCLGAFFHGEAVAQEIEDREAREGEEDEKFFFAN